MVEMQLVGWNQDELTTSEQKPKSPSPAPQIPDLERQIVVIKATMDALNQETKTRIAPKKHWLNLSTELFIRLPVEELMVENRNHLETEILTVKASIKERGIQLAKLESDIREAYEV